MLSLDIYKILIYSNYDNIYFFFFGMFLMNEVTSVENKTDEPNSGLRILIAIHNNNVARKSFIHGLRLAYAAKGELEVVDVRPRSKTIENLGVREYLEKWGVLSPDSKRSDVAALGLKVKKVIKTGNQKQLLIKRIKRHPHDLLVIGTESRSNQGGIIGRSVAVYLADHFRHITLFIPSSARPFIDEATGQVALKRIVMPVENDRFFQSAQRQLIRLLSLLPELKVEVILLHAGKEFPQLSCEHSSNIIWKEELRDQSVVEAIVMVAENYCADLVVMSTDGRNTLAQKIIGSNTERVLRSISCPLLSVSVAK